MSECNVYVPVGLEGEREEKNAHGYSVAFFSPFVHEQDSSLVDGITIDRYLETLGSEWATRTTVHDLYTPNLSNVL